MNKKYMKGELLKLVVKNSDEIEGRFYSISNDMSSISLYDVKESGSKSNKIFHYYDSEIRDIVKIPDPDVRHKLKISPKQCEEIIKVSKKYIYINQVDSAFHEALKDLKQYSYVAVSTDGASMGRKCKMPFLVMSTPHQVYIFDIQVMQYHAFDAGLSKLLEDEQQKKIVHDCRNLSDCLFHKHNIQLKGVFDTQVGDVIITRHKIGGIPKTVKTLAECLNCYLGLPPTSVEDKLDIVQCTERPLSPKIKERLAKNIAFLHRLSETINDEMNLPFVRGVECYIESLRSLDDFKAWELSGKINEIPKDFKSSIDY